MLKILLAASEVAPIIKLGGLGDVTGSLPKALEKIKVNMDVVVPFFPTAKIENLKTYKSLELEVPYDNSTHVVEVFKTKLPGSQVDVFLLRNAQYFGGGGKGAFLNVEAESQLFAFFSRAVVELIKSTFNTYDIIHCNDWHTSLITHLLEDEIGQSRPKTLLTIHNLSYQGAGSLELVQDLGLVPGEHRLIEWDLEDNSLNFLLQGITSSDYLSTVSPQYAKEILFKNMAGDLADILQNRSARLTGILNGIDYQQFKRAFKEAEWRKAKTDVKHKLQKRLKLKKSDAPLFSFISRLDPNQKGVDILLDVIPDIDKFGGQFVLLGTGDTDSEKKLKDLEKISKENISINIEFDVDLAKEIYAASDFILVPSKFEPCGLTQMIAMHYGTLPIVHGVGGLKDSVDDGVDGFVFLKYSSEDFSEAVLRATKIYADSSKYEKMVRAAFAKDFSWDKSAKKYQKLYEKMLES